MSLFGKEQLILTLLNYFLDVVGLISTFFFLFGVIKYLFSKNNKYLKIIFWSIIALIIVFAGYAIIVSPTDHFPVTNIPNSVITSN